MTNETEKRKASHLRVCLDKDVQAQCVHPGFRDLTLIHRALPEINRNDVDLSTVFLKKRMRAPLVISAMTGGAREAEKINITLAEVAERMGLAMGVGSQRAAIEDKSLVRTFRVVRDSAPSIPLMANLGAPQLGAGWGIKEALEAVDMIEADGLAIHLNPLQEALQPEGEPRYRGVLEKIREIKEALGVPLIVKETGAGVSSEDAKRLEDAGVNVLDVAGAGGTSWAAVEHYRAKDLGEDAGIRLCKTFWDWGIPSAASIAECAWSSSLPLIASGGIRSGLDAAKAIALGADLVGVALPFLKAAAKGRRELQWEVEMILNELSCAMFLTGARDLEELGQVPIVATGFLADWFFSRGYSTIDLARRSAHV